MKLLYTPTNSFSFNEYNVESHKNADGAVDGITVVYIGEGNSIAIRVTAETILNNTLESSFQDCSSYYVAFNEGATGFTFINKFAETFYTKQGGTEYLRSRNMQVPIQIYIPWASKTLDEATIRVCGPNVPNFDGTPLTADLCIEATAENFQLISRKLLPSLKSPDISESPVKVQLLLDGAEHARAGVLVVAKLESSLVSTSALTDENGVATFEAPAGATVEFGFKYYSNITKTLVE